MPSKKAPAKKGGAKPAAPEPQATDTGEQDVEGHFMLPDYTTSREVARHRVRETEKRTERHGLEEGARRPSKPKKT